MMRLPLVSVLIPSYNSKEYLSECLESALAQTYEAVEIIVVDDGSNDGSLELARHYSDRGVKVISRSNGGQAAALNTAFAAASGQFIQYLDADDVLDGSKIAHQVTRLLRAEAGVVATGAWARFHEDVGQAIFTAEPIWQDLEPVDWLVSSWLGGGMMHVAAWLLPRPMVEAAGPWAEPLRWAANLDGHFFTRAVLASTGCVFCADAKSFYRSGHPSMSSWSSRRSQEATLQVLLENGAALLARENSPRTRRASAAILQRFVYAIYPDHIDLVRTAEKQIKLMGGSPIAFSPGRATQAVSKLIGWKLAKRCRGLIDKWSGA
jgi:glycosyltransferase involved in cell wall biosynthesis